MRYDTCVCTDVYLHLAELIPFFTSHCIKESHSDVMAGDGLVIAMYSASLSGPRSALSGAQMKGVDSLYSNTHIHFRPLQLASTVTYSRIQWDPS